MRVHYYLHNWVDWWERNVFGVVVSVCQYAKSELAWNRSRTRRNVHECRIVKPEMNTKYVQYIAANIYLQIVFQNCYVHHLRLKRKRFIRISEIDSIWRVYAVSFFIFMHGLFAIIMVDLLVFICFYIAKTKSYLWILPIF